VDVEIQLTKTYRAIMANPTGRISGTPWDYLPRPPGFLARLPEPGVGNGRVVTPISLTGAPNYFCGGADSMAIAAGGYCCLTGATVPMELLADRFDSNSATAQTEPRGGDPINVNFELYALP
jgi:hypothetical protein